MARATHLTIGTADRIRLDAVDSGTENRENEVRQEVQVSVTYALEAGDTNLVVLAERKALEVKLAHEAVWDRIGAFSSKAFSSRSNSSNAFSSTSSQSGNGSGMSNGRDNADRWAGRHDADENFGEEDGNDDPDDEPQGAGLPPDPPPVDPPMGGPARGAWYMPGGSRSGNAAASPELSQETDQETDAEPLTGPQRILIRSRAKKAGLTPYALESLVYQQFKAWKVEKLTKEQAAALLAALERDLTEKERTEMKGNGKEGVSHASDTHANGSGHAAPAGTA